MEPKAAQKLGAVLGMMYEQLQNAATKDDLKDLREVAGDLAEAQKHIETRLVELTEARKRTETRLDELAQAQKSLTEAQIGTETSLACLADRLDDTNKQMGGISNTIGYTLENAADRALPPLLERDHGLKLTEPLRRDYLAAATGRDLEVNIVGRGTKDGEPVWIIGEAKARLSQNEVNRFIRGRVAPLTPVCGKIIPLLVAHMFSAPDVPA